MHDQRCVAVLGAGSTMGIRVLGWNRTLEKARPLEEDGGEVLGSAREAVDGADVVLTMLSDPDGWRPLAG